MTYLCFCLILFKLMKIFFLFFFRQKLISLLLLAEENFEPWTSAWSRQKNESIEFFQFRSDPFHVGKSAFNLSKIFFSVSKVKSEKENTSIIRDIKNYHNEMCRRLFSCPNSTWTRLFNWLKILNSSNQSKKEVLSNCRFDSFKVTWMSNRWTSFRIK